MKPITPPRLALGIAILFMAAEVQTASAATIYNITLTPTIGTIGGTGTFTWNGSSFTNFTVTWGTETFDFLTAANAATMNSHRCDGGASISFFTFLTTSDCEGSMDAWAAYDFGSLPTDVFIFSFDSNGIIGQGATGTYNGGSMPSAIGAFEVAVATPEPDTFLLMPTGLLALAALASVRKVRRRRHSMTRPG